MSILYGLSTEIRHELAIGRKNPVHKEVQPLATMPYVNPNANKPAKVLERTPQRTKVDRAVDPRVPRPRAQGLNRSDRMPIESLPRIEAPCSDSCENLSCLLGIVVLPFKTATVEDELELLRCKSVAKAGCHP